MDNLHSSTALNSVYKEQSEVQCKQIHSDGQFDTVLLHWTVPIGGKIKFDIARFSLIDSLNSMTLMNCVYWSSLKGLNSLRWTVWYSSTAPNSGKIEFDLASWTVWRMNLAARTCGAYVDIVRAVYIHVCRLGPHHHKVACYGPVLSLLSSVISYEQLTVFYISGLVL